MLDIPLARNTLEPSYKNIKLQRAVNPVRIQSSKKSHFKRTQGVQTLGKPTICMLLP